MSGLGRVSAIAAIVTGGIAGGDVAIARLRRVGVCLHRNVKAVGIGLSPVSTNGTDLRL